MIHYFSPEIIILIFPWLFNIHICDFIHWVQKRFFCKIDQFTVASVDQFIVGSVDQFTVGSVNQFTKGSVDQLTVYCRLRRQVYSLQFTEGSVDYRPVYSLL